MQMVQLMPFLSVSGEAPLPEAKGGVREGGAGFESVLKQMGLGAMNTGNPFAPEENLGTALPNDPASPRPFAASAEVPNRPALSMLRSKQDLSSDAEALWLGEDRGGPIDPSMAALGFPVAVDRAEKLSPGKSDLADRRFGALLAAGEGVLDRGGAEGLRAAQADLQARREGTSELGQIGARTPFEGLLRSPGGSEAPVAITAEATSAPTKPAQASVPASGAAQALPSGDVVSENSSLQNHGSSQPKSVQSPPVLHLSSGQALPESRVVDQVVGRLVLGRGEDAQSLTLRLHPRELGEVKLNLIVEKDQVKAQLIAQSQQVQGILEKNLPTLRTALEAQGLRLDSLQVSVESQGEGGRGLFQEHHRSASPVRFAVRGEGAEEKDHEPLAANAPRHGSGINVRI